MDIDTLLLDYCRQQTGASWQRIARHIAHGGKRLRPRLCLGSYQLHGGNDPNIIYVAAAWEIFHIGLLIHDDIMDGDYLRHG